METDKILLGDAYELIKSTPDKSVDLVLTSPPYGIDRKGQPSLDTDYDEVKKQLVSER